MLDNTFEKKSASRNGDHRESPSSPNGSFTGDRAVAARAGYVPQDAEPVDIFRLLDQLEELPEKAANLPFNTLLGFDKEKFYYLVLKVRANLPEDLKKAQRVARDSERIVDEARGAAVQQMESGRVEAARVLEDARAESIRIREAAQAESRRMVEQARQQAAALVDKSEVHQMAVAQAHDLVRRAENEASEIRKGADEYARDVLTNLESVMGKAIVTVQRGRETLENARR